MAGHPLVRVHVPSLQGPVLSIPACCEDPTPDTEPRKTDGDLTRQQLYCANCDKDWMDFAWNTADVEAIRRAQVGEGDTR